MAGAVMALALMSVIPVMQRAFVHVDRARSLEIAANILETEFEKERLLSWDRLTDSGYVPVIDGSFTRVPSIAGRFTLARSIEQVADHEGELVQVTLSVTWRGMDGRSLTRSYSTYFGKNGLYDYLHDKS